MVEEIPLCVARFKCGGILPFDSVQIQDMLDAGVDKLTFKCPFLRCKLCELKEDDEGRCTATVEVKYFDKVEEHELLDNES